MIEDILNDKSLSIDPDELRRILRERFDGREHWLIVFDRNSKVVIDLIANRYYQDAGAEDFSVYVVLWGGGLYGVGVLRKRRMLSHCYQSILRQVCGLRLTEREIVSRDVNICTTPARLLSATNLIDLLLNLSDREEGGRTPVEAVPTYDGVLPSAPIY